MDISVYITTKEKNMSNSIQFSGISSQESWSGIWKMRENWENKMVLTGSLGHAIIYGY